MTASRKVTTHHAVPEPVCRFTAIEYLTTFYVIKYSMAENPTVVLGQRDVARRADPSD